MQAAMSERSLLMIPGPIEFEPEVLRAVGRAAPSHMDPDFVRVFGRALGRMRDVFGAPTGQPFVVAGSGTLAMELAVANVIEAGERAVVVNTGYFSDRMGSILERLGARVVHVRAPVGGAPSLEEIEKAVAAEPTKLVTITQVDTSTGVLADVEGVARVARAHGALSAVDGVCATGGERFAQDAWGVDVCLTASQKAIGVPPGLALVMASPRALDAWKARKTKVASMYLDWGEWLPIMSGYEKGAPAYFATPAVTLIMGLEVSLGQLVAEGMDARFSRHARIAGAFRAAWSALGLRLLPLREDLAANTLSAVCYPDGIDASLVARVKAEGVVIAGGLHPEVKAKYFRVGHMGAVSASDTLATIGAVERALATGGYAFTKGAGLAAAQAVLGAKAT
ncbi:Serine--glyoxylate aminotransferase [Minicystis rosea]|nr:Serine--glyoxylate aminotransferase [Minicystis rosea]